MTHRRGCSRAGGIRDPQANELYLLGRQLLNRRAGARRTALPYLERAVARDPTFAPAQAALAKRTFAVLSVRNRRARRRGSMRSRHQAPQLDDRLAVSHATLG
jgi:hypothetical protein